MDDDGREQNEKRLIIHWTVSGCFFSCLLLSLLLLLLLTCHLSRCHCWLVDLKEPDRTRRRRCILFEERIRVVVSMGS